MAKPGRGGGRPPSAKGKKKEPASIRPDDVYEAEDSDPDELRHAQRFDQVDNYEYEMPSDFEDEEIDEEMAFTEEDKKMFGHLFDDSERPAGGNEGGSGSEGDLLSSGESGGEEEGGGDQEGWIEEENGGQGGGKRQRDEVDELFGDGFGDSGEEEGGSSEGSEGGEGSQDGIQEEGEEEGDDEEAATARHAAMLEAVTGGGGGGAAAAARRKQRAKEVVVTEAYPESAYNLPPSAAGEVTVADLIAGLGDSKSKLGATRKLLERMEKKAAPVTAPLPGPIKQRQERKAGYEESKKEVDKWMPIIKANREAPTLRFTAAVSAVPRTTTTAALASKHTPEAGMEAEVAALLQAACAHSTKAVAEAEEALAMKALSVEEARERQNRLARMRALLFYHEAKAKRLKKIKSKEYRRKLKKADKRKAEAAGGEEGDEAELQVMQEQVEFDRAKERLTLKHRNTSRWARRAIKRGQTLTDEGTRLAVAEQLRLGQELRQRVNRMKVSKGGDSGASTSASDGEGGSGDEGQPGGGSTFAGPGVGRGMSSRVKAAALELLEGGAGTAGEAPATGLFALPFMRRALDRKKLEAQQAAEEVLREFEGGSGGGGMAAVAHGGGGRAGRLTFTGTGVDQRQQWERVMRKEAAALNDESDLASDEDEDTEAKVQQLCRRLGQPQQQQQEEEERQRQAGGDTVAVSAAEVAAATEAVAATAGSTVAVTDGPIGIDLPPSGSQRRAGVLEIVTKQQRGGAAQQDWLLSSKQGDAALAAAAAAGPAGAAGSKRSGKWQQVAAGVSIAAASGSAAERQQNSIAAPAAALADQLQQEHPAFVQSKGFQGARPGYVFKKGTQGMGYFLDTGEAAKATQAAQQQQRRRRQQQQQAATAVPYSEDEGNIRPMEGSGGGGLTQAELIRRAFAGDDVATEFAASKAAEVEGELPQEELPGVLPGWGTWAGHQREPKWAIEAKRKAQQRKEAAAAGRKDAKLQYVVISEKWDKKSSKYMTPTVPFPFDSKETYERAMRQPLGREYNTDASFRNLTRPTVLKDAGVIIEPIRFSKAMAQHDEQAAKRRAPVTIIAGGMPKKSKKH